MSSVSAVSPPDGVLSAIGGASDDVDELRTCVTIGRTHPTDCGMRQVFAKLDNILRVTLTFGESVTEDIPPGRHRLRVHNTLFWKTIDFTIEPGEHLGFLVINSARWWTYGMAGVLGSAPLFLTVRKTSLL
jgi:hypothetical protein